MYCHATADDSLALLIWQHGGEAHLNAAHTIRAVYQVDAKAVNQAKQEADASVGPHADMPMKDAVSEHVCSEL